MSRVDLLGCTFDDLTVGETLERVEQIIRARRPRFHAGVNVDVLVRMRRDPAYAALVNACDLVLADGVPVVVASHLLRRPLKGRVAGPDLFDAILEEADVHGRRIYLLGARPAVVERVAATLAERHPGLQLVGFRDGYWHEDEERAVAEAVRDAAPDILFLATGSPRKELFLHRWGDLMAVPFTMGAGGAFDVVAGETRRAPRVLQRAGLEWFYRFLQEPRRLFRRYFIDDVYFFVLLAKEVMRSIRLR